MECYHPCGINTNAVTVQVFIKHSEKADTTASKAIRNNYRGKTDLLVGLGALCRGAGVVGLDLCPPKSVKQESLPHNLYHPKDHLSKPKTS